MTTFIGGGLSGIAVSVFMYSTQSFPHIVKKQSQILPAFKYKQNVNNMTVMRNMI